MSEKASSRNLKSIKSEYNELELIREDTQEADISPIPCSNQKDALNIQEDSDETPMNR